MMQKNIIAIVILSCLLNLALDAQMQNPVNTITPDYSRNFTFIENKGQILDQNNFPNSSVHYLLLGNGLNVAITANGFSYDSYRVEKNLQEESSLKLAGKNNLFGESFTYHFHRIDIEMVGANTNPQIITGPSSATYYNYFTTGTPENGISNVRSFKTITYKNIYPNIDVQFISDLKAGFKYNFIIHPGGDYKKIKLKYKGAENINMVNGEILISTSNGKIKESIPLSYLEENNQSIKVNYELKNKNEHGESFVELSFNSFESIDATKTLVIDPTPNLLWGTYYGGNLVDNANSITLDAANNIYVAGLTKSTSNIATVGAYQATITGTQNDAFVAKFNSTGTSLVWGTYYGASGNDMALSIAIDGNGDLLITGLTSSTDSIATPGSWQTIFGGGTYDAFVAKFNSSGTSLLWGTYYGGTDNDFGYSIVVDTIGDVLITGYTKSQDSISSIGAYQTIYGGGAEDAFVAKLNSSGTNRIWGTYFGGSLDDWGNSIALAPNGNIYITGYTSSPDGISTPGAWRLVPIGNGDGFIAGLNSTGTVLLAGTYYGGTQEDQSLDIAIDGSGNLNITGYTSSISGIASAGEWQTSFAGIYDAFVSKFNPTCTNLIWGTYYGGSGDDEGYSIAIDGTDNLLVTGFTKSAAAISTPGAWQSSFGGNTDAFVSKFNPAGTNLEWGTYYGGSGQDEGMAIVLDGNSNLFVTGWTKSTDSISTVGSYQQSINGTTNSFVAQFDGVNSGIPVLDENYFSFNAFPVPTSNLLYLEIENIQNETIQISVLNLIGQSILERNAIENYKGTLSTVLDFSDFADGIYLVNIIACEQSFTRKIVVKH